MTVSREDLKCVVLSKQQSNTKIYQDLINVKQQIIKLKQHYKLYYQRKSPETY